MEIKEDFDFREVCAGFKQVYRVTGNYEILVSTIRNGVGLPVHSHDYAQFGYCFMGVFKFVVQDMDFIIKQNESYLVYSNIPHGVQCITDMLALDIKFIHDAFGDKPFEMIGLTERVDGDFILRGYENNRMIFREITHLSLEEYSLELPCYNDNFLVVAETLLVKSKGDIFGLQPMKIYRVVGDVLKISGIDPGGKLYLLQVK